MTRKPAAPWPTGRRLGWLALAPLALVAVFHLAAPRPPPPGLDGETLRAMLAQYPTPLSVSPDGGRVLEKTRHEGDFEIAVRDLKTGAVLASLRSPDTQFQLAWSPDGRAIAFLASASGNRRYKLHVWDLRSNAVSATAGPVTNTALAPLRWSPRADRIAYFSGGRGRSGQIVSVELPLTGRPRETALGASFAEADFQWSPDGTALALVPVESSGSVRLAGGRAPSMALVLSAGGVVRDLAWSSDGAFLLASVRGPREEFFRLALADIRTGAARDLVRAPFDLGRPVWLPGGKRFLFEGAQDGMTRVYASDLSGRRSAGESPRELSTRILGLSTDGSRVFHWCSRLDGPPFLAALSLAPKKFSPLTPGSPSAGPAPERLKLPSKPGALPIIVWKPRGAPAGARRPGMIYVHGGPHLQESPLWDARVQALVDKGFTVVAVNYRGSTGYGQAFEREESLEGQARDVLAAQEFMTSKAGVSAGDLVLCASSAGTRIAVEALRLKPAGFGSLVLLSTLALQKQECPPPGSLKHVYAFQGRQDDIHSAPRAYETLTRCFGQDVFASPRNLWRVFPDEGHQFQRTRSWAEIYSKIGGNS